MSCCTLVCGVVAGAEFPVRDYLAASLIRAKNKVKKVGIFDPGPFKKRC
jgi:hypothetical protein